VSKKIAVVLFNLGGPDSLEAVKPFLFNLFNDKAIISAPNPMRWCLAKFISSKREKTAQEIYGHLGGKSPILELTNAQADALETELKASGVDAKVFVSMRYWHPMAAETFERVVDYAPDEVILLPLYPQYSTTTTDSSVQQWKNMAKKRGFNAFTHTVCSYHTEPTYIKAHADSIIPFIQKEKLEDVRVLFSAHGLPKKIADLEREIYCDQIEETVAAVVNKLAIKGLDYKTCYQSRVGPLEWVGPSTDDEMARAGKDKKSVVVIPIAFVSEHSETLVELDIEYKEMAESFGVPSYHRVPALGTDPMFIKSLKTICNQMLNKTADPAIIRNCTSDNCDGVCTAGKFNLTTEYKTA
jgi:ferrochelatase